MFNKKVNLIRFQPYIDRAIEECHNLSFAEKTQGLWSEPEIVRYFSRMPSEEPIECLALSLKEILPDINNKKILCIGGGTGKLGRRIVALYPGIHVVEIDSSKEMVQQANKLAFDKALGDRFVFIEADAKILPFKDNSYDYAIAYGIFRYIDQSDYEKVLSEITRVTNKNFTIAESILKELIFTLKDEFINDKCLVKETAVSMFRISLFYMLFKEYKINNDFKILIDSETETGIDTIDVLTSVAGLADGTLYELRVRNNSRI